MKYLLILLLSIIAFASKADDCTFNKEAQIKHLQKIMDAHPGGKLDSQTNSITWQNINSPANYYAYGGCYDLGLTVKKTLESINKLSLHKIFTIASSLANNYLSANQAKVLQAAITNGAYTVENDNGIIYYQIQSNLYSDFNIEYNQAESYISISLVENL